MKQETIHYPDSPSCVVIEEQVKKYTSWRGMYGQPEGRVRAGCINFDTGRGQNENITKRAWHVFDHTNHQQELFGYQDKSKGEVYPLVDSVTKDRINDRYLPIFILMNYATMIYYKEKNNILMSHLRSRDIVSQFI